MKFFWLLTSFFVPFHLFSQVEYYRFPVEEKQETVSRRISIEWANDVFFQTDRYFTNGLRIEYHNQNLKFFPLSKLLYNPLVETQGYYGFTLTHDIFTPRNTYGDPDPEDRPFAGYLLLGIKSTHFGKDKKFSFSTELQAGMLGKYSGGEFVQNGIHMLLPASEPIPGWYYQIENNFCVNYSINYAQQLFAYKKLKSDILASGRIGLPYTDLGGGARIRFSGFDDFYSVKRLLQPEDFRYTFFAEARLNLVIYDATLQGGVISPSMHTLKAINSFNAVFKLGANIKWKKLVLEAGTKMNTLKFSNALPHKWAYFTIGHLF